MYRQTDENIDRQMNTCTNRTVDALTDGRTE